MPEVLTLQIGNFANHVGTHFWNFQDEIAGRGEGVADDDSGGPGVDLSRVYSESEREGVVSWRPRLVLVDQKGALGSLPGLIDVAPPEAVAELWQNGAIEQIELDRPPVHSFQRDLEQEEFEQWGEEGEGGGMDYAAEGADQGTRPAGAGLRTAAEYDFRQTARSWTDFLKIRVPSSSVHELQAWHHGVAPFATYFDGLDIKSQNDGEEILDSIRRQAELCDRLDGVHSIYDMHNGFGGVAGIMMTWLKDEQPKCGTFVAAVMPELQEQDLGEDLMMQNGPVVAAQDVDACAWVSAAFSFHALMEEGMHVWTPIQVPLWSTQLPAGLAAVRRDSPYETSALIAAALETSTLPYRLGGGLRPSEFLSTMTPSHRPVCGLLQALPLPPPVLAAAGVAPDPRANQQLLAGLAPAFFDLAATPSLPGNPYSSLVLRGSDPRRLLALSEGLHPRARRLCFAHEARLPLPVPFPQYFAPEVSPKGVLHDRGMGWTRPLEAEVEEMPTATHLHAAAHAGRCAPLRRMVVTMKAHKHSAWAAGVRARYGVEADDFREVLNTVMEHLECGAASSSDGGSDGDSDMS